MSEGDSSVHVNAMTGSAIASGEKAVAVSVTVNQAPDSPSLASSQEISTHRLPNPGAALFGREAELAELDRHWTEHSTVLTIVAEGGVGKTALVRGWLDQLKRRDYDGASVFAWSSYMQGSTDQASADEFIAEALGWCGYGGELPKSPMQRGELLARELRKRRTLLVIDGLEPLQYPPGQMTGFLKDQAVLALVNDLEASNPGLCLITTRLAVTDLDGKPQIDLSTLSPEAGAQLLAALGVDGTAEERAQVAKSFGGHALALTLLGTYLRDVYGGDLRRHGDVPMLTDDIRAGCHARRVMAAYEAWLEPEYLAVLGLVSLFDRPAAPELVQVVRRAAILPALPETEPRWRITLTELRRARLLYDDDTKSGTLDTHPLIRAYFADHLRRTQPDAWIQAHGRLYEHLRDTTPEFPDTLPGLEPLYQAVAHGCKAGRHQEALGKVYWPRILRQDKHFSLHALGAFGAELSALAGFFASPWDSPVATIMPEGQAWLLGEAGFTLRAVGRLDEAVTAMLAGLDACERQGNWENAAISAANLSEAHLLRGEVTVAVEMARRAVELADRSEDGIQKLARRTDLANALAQAGDSVAATAEFVEAERIQAEQTPNTPRLSSFGGYRYCDLLLDDGAIAEVRARATAARTMAERHRSLLDIALDTLSLGRAAALGKGDQAEALLSEAVAKLREAGGQDHIPRGLLARAAFFRGQNRLNEARRDLEEVSTIARRGGMRLYLADVELEEARLALAAKDHATARAHLATAQTQINNMGYHRRDKDLIEIAQALEED